MSDQEDSVFTKIIKGELPAYKVYEDELTIAFMPLHPVALGHVLVVSKKQVDQFFELDEADYLAVSLTVKKVAIHMKEVLGVKRIGIKVVGEDVPHVHYHLLAFNTVEQYNELEDVNAPVNHEMLKNMAEKLAF